MLQERDCQYGKRYQRQHHHHVDVPWVGHRQHSYQSTLHPYCRCFYMQRSMGKGALEVYSFKGTGTDRVARTQRCNW